MFRGLFERTGLVSSAAIFPDIDTGVIARRLDLDKRGRERGAKNFPSETTTDLDSVETEAVEDVDRIRRSSLQTYEDQRQVYRQRFDRAAESRRDVELTVSETTGDFTHEIRLAEQSLRQHAQDVQEAYHWLMSFRQANRLDRPAHVANHPWLMLIALGTLMCAFEAVLNSATFAGSHEAGLIGGTLLALLIAVVNVATASLLGGFMRMKNHVKILPRLIGITLLLIFICFAFGFNLGVAHFRDAMAQADGVEAAATSALNTLRTDPLGLTSMQSWLLFILGGLVASASALKAYSAFDPYPGYAQVSRALRTARLAYQDAHYDALKDIEARRDDALHALEDSRKTTEGRINDAIAATEGFISLSGQLETFLVHCDRAAARLLVIYRDANRETRTIPEPPTFSRTFKFPVYEPAPMSWQARDSEADRKSADKMIDAAIKTLIKQYDVAVNSFASIETHELGAASEIHDPALDTDSYVRTAKASPSLTVVASEMGA